MSYITRLRITLFGGVAGLLLFWAYFALGSVHGWPLTDWYLSVEVKDVVAPLVTVVIAAVWLSAVELSRLAARKRSDDRGDALDHKVLLQLHHLRLVRGPDADCDRPVLRLGWHTLQTWTGAELEEFWGDPHNARVMGELIRRTALKPDPIPPIPSNNATARQAMITALDKGSAVLSRFGSGLMQSLVLIAAVEDRA
ncbi:MAG: hypothetical protein KDD44_06360, partial [Bdellovibrionales bacterium]|nr:hypothetical protein [Bdellovibrionales bacterium]